MTEKSLVDLLLITISLLIKDVFFCSLVNSEFLKSSFHFVGLNAFFLSLFRRLFFCRYLSYTHLTVTIQESAFIRWIHLSRMRTNEWMSKLHHATERVHRSDQLRLKIDFAPFIIIKWKKYKQPTVKMSRYLTRYLTDKYRMWNRREKNDEKEV